MWQGDIQPFLDQFPQCSTEDACMVNFCTRSMENLVAPTIHMSFFSNFNDAEAQKRCANIVLDPTASADVLNGVHTTEGT